MFPKPAINKLGAEDRTSKGQWNNTNIVVWEKYQTSKNSNWVVKRVGVATLSTLFKR